MVSGFARVSASSVIFFTSAPAFPYVTLDAAGAFEPVLSSSYFNASTPDGATAVAIAKAIGLMSPGGRRLVKRASAIVVADL